MQITLSLPDEIGHELKTLPNPERFVSGLVEAALHDRRPKPLESAADWTAFFAKRARLLADFPQVSWKALYRSGNNRNRITYVILS